MSESPNTPPVDSSPPITVTADQSLIGKKMKFWLHGIWISISAIIFIPLIGICITVISMRGAFSDVGASGVADPDELAAHIGQAMVATSVGFLFAILSIVPLVISIVQYWNWKRRLVA